MTILADHTLEPLCDLFAPGSMKYAKKIARLLVQEIDKPRPQPEALRNSELLRGAAITLQTAIRRLVELGLKAKKS